MKLLVIAWTSLVRLFRDRSNWFFVFVLPAVLILVLGIVFGGGFKPRVGLVQGDDGPLAVELVAAIEGLENLDVRPVASASGALDEVERGNLEAAVVIPAAYDASLRSGEPVEIRYIASPSSGGLEVQSLVSAEIAAQAARVRAAHFAVEQLGFEFDAALAAATAARAFVGGVDVIVTGDTGGGSTIGQFDLGAAQNLVLFMFITSMAGSAALIQSRRYGVSRRMLATPTRPAVIIAGEGLGRFAVALFQGLFIVLFAALLFGVDWGAPLGAAALVLAFSLVGAGAGMLMGSIFENDEQAAGLGVFLSLGLGALGGCMVPLEVFPPTMRTIAHATPHAWALDGFGALIRDDAGVAAVANEVGVLLLFAAGLLAVSAYLFRRALTR